MEPNKMKPAIIGGAVAGILSVIPLVSTCCCIWALGGGFLAAHLYNKEAGSRGLLPAEGATIVAMAGGVAAAIAFVITIPITLLLGPIQEEILRSYGVPSSGGAGIVGAITGAIIVAGLLAIFATIGGLLASLVYKPTGGPGAPPPTYPGSGGPYESGGPVTPPYGGGTPGGPAGQGGPYGQGGGQPPY